MKNEIDVIKFLVSSEINKKLEQTKNEVYNISKITNIEVNQLVKNTLERIERKVESALNEVRVLKTDLETQKNDVNEKLEKLSDLINIAELGINKESLLQLFKDNQKNKEWFKYNSSDIELIRSDYNKTSKQIMGKGKKGIFEKLATQMNNEKTDVQNTVKPEHILGTMKNGLNYKTDSGYSIKVVDNEINIESPDSKSKITIDEKGIHLSGDVYINGKII